MSIQERRDKYHDALKDALGWSYEYGGQSNHSGFDCSGLVIWALRRTGMPVRDMTAGGLFEFFHPYKCLPSIAQPGTLFFYWDEKRNIISHVMSVYMVWPNGTRVLAGARGGTSKTVTLADATRDNALVDLVIHDHYWQGNFAMALDPFLNEGDWL